MTVLFVAGIGVILAGLLAIGFGIPVKEFGFGNTLILTGTIVACTGLVMLSLVAVVRELKRFADLMSPAAASNAMQSRRDAAHHAETIASDEDAGERAAGKDGALFSRDQSAVERTAASDSAAPPWQQEVLRERSRGTNPADGAQGAAEPKQRRNLLFSSTRRERDLAAAEQASGTPEHDQAAPAPVADAAVAPRASFEEAWPQVERARAEQPRRSSRAPSTFQEAPAAPAERTAPRHDAAVDVTLLKSGVVDGMGYSLYSDGSIEAQLPEGTMRFASIEELREHLDHRA